MPDAAPPPAAPPPTGAGSAAALSAAPPSGEAAPSGDSMAGSFSELDKMGGDLGTSVGQPPPTKPTSDRPAPAKVPEKPPEKAPEKQLDKPPEKVPDKPPEKTPDKPEGDTSPAPAKKPARGWEMFHNEQKKTKELEARIVELQQKQAPEIGQDHPEIVRYKTQAEAALKRAQELEEHIKFVDYEKSSEFKTKYHDPYVSMVKAATAQVSQLHVPAPDGSGNFVAQDPNAAADLFWAIVSEPSEERALAAAEKAYGSPSKAAFVMSQRMNVRAAHQTAEQAKESFRTQGAERAKLTAEQSAAAEVQRDKTWKMLNDSALEKYPHWFKPVDGDEKGNALLQKGFDLIDQVFAEGKPIKEGQKEMTEQQLMFAHSMIRNKAAGFDRLAYQLQQVREKNEILEKELAEYEKSAPTAGSPAPGEVASTEKSWEQELEQAASPNR